VFPLLCPVLEYDWLEDWRAEMLYTVSGVAEEGAVFRTRLRGKETWIASRYEPPQRVQYTIFARAALVVLDIRLEETEVGETQLQWQRTYTPITRRGRLALRRLDHQQVQCEMAATHECLTHYLATGVTLSKATAAQRARERLIMPGNR